MMKVVITTAAIRRLSSQIITPNKPTPGFLQAGCLSCRPTNGVRALKEDVLCYEIIRQSTEGNNVLQIC